jgi:hypothetical protein
VRPAHGDQFNGCAALHRGGIAVNWRRIGSQLTRNQSALIGPFHPILLSASSFAERETMRAWLAASEER